MQDISLWASSCPLSGLARTSRHTRRCVGLKSSCTKRITIARASPSRAVPSKIIEASFTLWSSALIFSLSLSSTDGIRSFIWLLVVNLWAYFSKRGRRISTFEMGIPAKSSVSTTSKRNSLISEGKVEPLAWSRLSCLCKHSRIVWFSFLILVRLEIPFKCFFDFTCFSIELFFIATASLQALHRNCPLTQTRCCPGNSCILSQTDVLLLAFFCTRLDLYLPLFTITFRFREIEALSGSERQAPLSIAT